MPDEQSLVDSLFTLIENTMFYGDRVQGGQFMSMMSPGQFLSLNLKEGNKNDEFIQYDVTNDCLDTSFIRKPLVSTIGGIYNEIFSFMAAPYKQLTPAQQQELAKDIAIVDQLQDAYNQYQDAFNKTDGDYQAALTNPDVDPVFLQQLANARQRAQQEWDTSGKRQQFEAAYSDSLYIQSGDPRAFFQKLNQQRTSFFLNSARGSYYRTLFEPAVADWSSASWTHAVLDTKTMSSSSYSRSTQWSGGLSVGWGLWSFGGSGGHSETYQHNHTEATEIAADLEYLRVKISRPWLDKDVFSFRFWTWLKTHGFVYLSDGGNPSANPSARPIGTMPFYPEEMIVVRNVKLSADFTATDNQMITSHMQAGASFGYGPFSISGSYSEDTSEVDTSATFDGATITITQPQIIAFLGDLLPQCPNPDPTLPWQGDEVFPVGMTSEQISKLRGIRHADRVVNRSRMRAE